VVILICLYSYWFGEWRTKKKYKSLLYHDRLTGLYNRDYLEDHKKTFGDCYVTIVDIDDLKHTNDTQGHEMGDVRIKYVAAMLDRYKGVTVRLGGDEFLLITDTYPNDIEHLLKFSSYGVVYKRHKISLSDAMREADRQMYKMKKKEVA
jgi:GGDEF domain-containing protein